jgi:hypothetical protein
MWRDDLKITANGSGLPSDRADPRFAEAVVLGALKVWPGKGRSCRQAGAMANLDSSCARRPQRSAGRDEETGLRSNKETDEETKTCVALPKLLDRPHTRDSRTATKSLRFPARRKKRNVTWELPAGLSRSSFFLRQRTCRRRARTSQSILVLGGFCTRSPHSSSGSLGPVKK